MHVLGDNVCAVSSQAGFFKSKYKNMINEAGQEADPGDAEASAQ